MAQLILVRHGQSLWNALNKFTGWVDVPLSERGRAEATIASCRLSGYRVNVCFTSKLIRAIETATICLTENDDICGGKIPIIKHEQPDADWRGWDSYDGNPAEELPIFTNAALDERFYGELQGLNKADTAAKYGNEQVQKWRRSYSVRPPGGESLEDTQQRVVAYFNSRILPHLRAGDNVLIAAHGNSLRWRSLSFGESIIMMLDRLSPDEVTALELATGVPIVYELDAAGGSIGKQILND
ncbi:2,3-bisphosphoglycerate-dependent phosphoglycerate mutase [Chamaesiphon minutus]|uniref:2,3-bisphosphoglycerate-dependent phosphoglycerate mutase n=1 Tax=Chamaesiphon minutus (strain ATCC 27169 / PCC 6605) TaxID=1173020 RepID=K9UD55_CHAP6|nr:2,3-bisphosphoglycerate-dependent phosphoglycerate mutase [Chamaesiphon minutus]AFY92346.1 phosphoglycerate mutase 1 [Chamaesiphon minutus PCC 6605]